MVGRYESVLNSENDPDSGWSPALTMRKGINDKLNELRNLIPFTSIKDQHTALATLNPSPDDQLVVDRLMYNISKIHITLNELGDLVDYETRSDLAIEPLDYLAYYESGFPTEFEVLQNGIGEIQSSFDTTYQIPGEPQPIPDENVTIEEYFSFLDYKISKSHHPQNIEELSSIDRVLLLPYKLSVHFKKKNEKESLLIRVLPDSMNLVNHFPYLTPEELSLAKEYWAMALDKVVKYGSKRNLKDDGITADLMGKVGAARASFILIKTTPIGWETLIENLTSIENPTVRRDQAELYQIYTKFPTIETRPKDQQIRSLVKLLPNQFTFYIYDHNGEIPYIEIGNPIPQELWVGFEENPDSKLKDPASSLIYSEDSAWMVDFDAAEEVGMAKTVQITSNEWENGFSKVIVTGIRLGDAIQNDHELNNLLEDHYYANEADIVPVGTPTNMIKELTQNEELEKVRKYEPELIFKRVIFPSSWQNPEDNSDGNILADKLGVNNQTTGKFLHAERQDQEDAKHINRSIYEATLGTYVKQTLKPIVEHNNALHKKYLQGFKEFWINQVNGRGTIPAIRIGNQPYTTLPITLSRELDFDYTDSYFLARYYKFFLWLRDKWDSLAANNQVNPSNPALKKFWDVLSQLPDSVEFRVEYSANDSAYSIIRNAISNGSDPLALVKDILNKLQNEPSLLGLDPGTDDIAAHEEFLNGIINAIDTGTGSGFPDLSSVWSAFVGDQAAFSQYLGINFQDLLFYSNRFFLSNLEFADNGFNLSAAIIHRIEEFRDYLSLSPELAVFEGKIVDQNIANDNDLVSYRFGTSGVYNYIVSLLSIDTTNDLLNETQYFEGSTVDIKPRALYYLLLYGSYFEEILGELSYWLDSGITTDPIAPNLNPDEGTLNEAGPLYQSNRQLIDRLNEPVSSTLLESIGIDPNEVGSYGELIFYIIRHDLSGNPNAYQWLQDPNKSLQKYRDSLKYLVSTAQGRLERGIIEALDSLMYRLDAWLTGLTSYQLDKIISQGGRCYVGGYGVLYNLKRRDFLSLSDKDHIVDQDSLGYVSAPSVSQAITSGILLQGSKSAQTIKSGELLTGLDPVRAVLDVNLTSLRSRVALYAVRGRLSGQAVSEYLGVTFEQHLVSGVTDPAECRDLVNFFRRRFAFSTSVKQLLRDSGYSDEKLGKIAEQNITDGFELFNYVKKSNIPYPFGLPELKPEQENIITSGIRQLFLSFDAMADLDTAEKVHNFVYRSLQNVDSPSDTSNKGKESTFLQSKHTGKTVQHSVGIIVNANILSDWGDANPSVHGNIENPAVPFSAVLQSGVSALYHNLLGNQSITCMIRTTQPNNNEVIEYDFTSSDINILGLIRYFNGSWQDACNSLSNHLYLQLAAKRITGFSFTNGYSLLFDFENSSFLSVRSAYDLYQQAKRIVSAGHTMSKHELVSGAPHPGPLSSEDKLYLQELLVELQAMVVRLTTSLSMNSSSSLDVIIEKLNAIRVVFLSGFISDSDNEFNQSFIDVLDLNIDSFSDDKPWAYYLLRHVYSGGHSILSSLCELVSGKLSPMFQLINSFNTFNENWSYQDFQTVKSWIALASAHEVMMPLYMEDANEALTTSVRNIFTQQAFINTDNEESVVKLSDWFYGVSKVNSNIDMLRNHYQVLEWDHDLDPLSLSLKVYQDLQLGETNHWVGLEIPNVSLIPSGCKSFTILNDSFDLSSKYVLGFVAQEWTEIIPDEDQVTGLAINYNQPDAEAPNLLLLTGQPSIRDWSSESLLAFVNEAFALTHIRKVNTDMVKQDPGLSTFLPAIANDYLPNLINRVPSHPRELDYTWVNKPRT